jgi:hypothetical protein
MEEAPNFLLDTRSLQNDLTSYWILGPYRMRLEKKEMLTLILPATGHHYSQLSREGSKQSS